jgi:hypothetical protein
MPLTLLLHVHKFEGHVLKESPVIVTVPPVVNVPETSVTEGAE